MSLQHKKASIFLQDCTEKPSLSANPGFMLPRVWLAISCCGTCYFIWPASAPRTGGQLCSPCRSAGGGGGSLAASDEQKIHRSKRSRCISLFIPERQHRLNRFNRLMNASFSEEKLLVEILTKVNPENVNFLDTNVAEKRSLSAFTPKLTLWTSRLGFSQF